MHRLPFRAMGCEMLAIVDGDGEATAALDNVPAWFESWEQAFSRFRAHSDLNRLNAHAGQWVPVGDALWEVVQAAIESAHATQGIVTPLVLGALVAAGYDRSFEFLAVAGAVSFAAPANVPDWRDLDWDARQHALRVPAHAGLDLGGTAKGWAADQTVARLATVGPALMDAGGDIAVNGPQADGEPWPIAVDIAGAGSAAPTMVMLRSGGVATSGRDYRQWVKNGQPQHHLIDPRTGRPAETDVLTATVVAPSAREAEAAAKVMLILGSQQGLAWIDARPWLAGLAVLSDGHIVHSQRMREYLWEPQ
ncbi:MAG: FAD:protein FMN transferase [Chloroflexi bacterium]|nr:FAD:protein FMN transferase [Chloroflexota bacterium]